MDVGIKQVGLLAGVLTLFTACPGGGQEPPAKAATPPPKWHEQLMADGYTAVEIKRRKEDHTPYVEAKLGDTPVCLMLDTGASRFTLSESACKAAKLAIGKEEVVVRGVNGTARCRQAAVPALSLGVDPPAAVWALCLPDEQFFDGLDAKAQVKVGGLLGDDLLQYYSAVVDYRSSRLFVIDPIRREKGLQGRWEAVAMTAAGEGRPAAGTVVTFRDAAVSFTLSGAEFTGTFRLDNPALTDRPINLMFDKVQAVKAVYQLDGDRLVLCGNFSGTSATARPTEFKSTKENGFSVITFRRVKAEKK